MLKNLFINQQNKSNKEILMAELIHLQTQIRTIFGRVDEEGNVVEQYPLNLNLKALNEEVFVESLAQIVKARKDLNDQLANPTAANVVSNVTTGDVNAVVDDVQGED
jgi:hypothetical protein